ncbi:MAG: HEAT repeat domain-containing protein [Gammaproteobacteria bacterium]
MALGKAGLLSLAVPAILATWLAAEASTESSRDNLTAALRSDRPNAATVSVSFRDGLLSVEAKAGTWRQLLNQITERTGIRFHHYLPFAGSVTVSFANLPVRQAIERLFGPEADFVFRYDGTAYSSSSLPKEVWVLGKVQGGGAWGQQSAPANNAGVDSNQAHVGTGRADKLAAAAEPPMDKASIDHFVAMSRDEDPQMRRQAIAALMDSGTGDEAGAVTAVLDAALTDEDAGVRAHGVQALAMRGGPDVIGHLWRALHDPSAEVRIPRRARSARRLLRGDLQRRY